jgi:hypothetical protein
MSPIPTAFALLAILLFVIALTGCVLIGTLVGKRYLGTPLALLVVVGVLLLVFSVGGRRQSVSFQSVSAPLGPVAQAQAPVQVQAQAGEPAKPVVKAPAAGSSRYPIWVLDDSNPDWKDNWKATPQQSMDEAVALITVELADYLHNQQPPIEWTPPPGFVESLVKDSVKLKEKELADAPGTKKYRYDGAIEIKPKLRAEIVRHDREFRSQQRMVWLALGVAGIVALLGVVAVYIRMDEMTKGYYTGWLRVAAVGFLGVTALVLLLIA